MKRYTSTALVGASLALCLVSPAIAAQKDLKQTHTYPAQEGKRVVVDVTSLNVSVRAADVHEVEVTTDLRISGVGEEKAERWIASRTPKIADTADVLTVAVKPGPHGFLGLGLLTARARIEIVVPPTMIPDVTSTSGRIRIKGDFPLAAPLMLRTATGEIELTGAATGVDIRTVSGDSRIELMRPLETLFVRTSSGSIHLTGGARTVHADTASGDVWLDSLSGPVEVVTSSGKITLRWDRLDAGDVARVRSSSGRVSLQIPSGVRPGGTLTTTAGTIRSDLPGTVSEAGDTVLLDGEGPTLEVESATGEIVIGPRD